MSKLSLKRTSVMSMFIEGLFLFGSFTLDLVIRVNKLFLDVDVTKLSGTWKGESLVVKETKIEIKRIN